MYYVYVLRSEKSPKRYVGRSKHPDKRLIEHNEGRTRSNKYGIPWEIVYTEKYNSIEEAIQRERYFKTAAGRRFLKNKGL